MDAGEAASRGSGGAAAQVQSRSGAPRACPKATRDKEAAPAPSGDGDDADGGAMSKRTCQLVETSSAAGGKRIKEVVFGLLSPEEMESLAEFECNNRELYTLPSRKPAPNGCLDLRLGAANKQTACAGHFGVVRLELPVFHVGYFKHVLTILQCVCKECSRALVHPQERTTLLRRMRDPRADALRKQALYKRVVGRGAACDVDRCKAASKCPYCGARNGPVRKVAGAGALKLSHEKWRGVKREDLLDDDEFSAYAESLESALGASADLRNALGCGGDTEKKRRLEAEEKSVPTSATATKAPPTVLSPVDVRAILEKISDDDCDLLWIDPRVGRPENLVLKTLLVPPTPIRPSVAVDSPGGGGSNEDDLTIKLQEIIDVNSALRQAIRKGGSMKMIVEGWNFLQVQVALYLNGEVPGLQPRNAPAAKPIRGLCQRLKGKSGRFRGNLSGKRVDFSARTVISPDPNLRVDQVGVPQEVAKIMTYPEKVNALNLEKLQKLVVAGQKQWPGANYVEIANHDDPGAGDRPPFKKSLLYGDRARIAKELRVGDVVERHMQDGDVVLFNRQPSLHKLSIMSHEVKVMPWRTFRFNECVCAPYNADFDGDEMNMHLPQTEEARAEASALMNVATNICTPRNGEPLVARDAGLRDRVVPPRAALDGQAALLVDRAADGRGEKPENGGAWPCVSFECAERNYTGSGIETMCPMDGYVLFRRSSLLCGNIAKKTVGDGSKKGLVYELYREHGPAAAATFMNRLAKLSARYLGYHKGFSIGIDDVTPSDAVLALKAQLLEEGHAEARRKIEAYESGSLALQPGCDALQSLEAELTGLLGKVREQAGKNLMTRDLPRSNSPRIMAECGSKGSAINVSQMIACLGQQAVDGKRIQNGFVQRTLPHFEVGELSPGARGFVANSFYSGLTATEFFFHTMGGREGLVDTAVKTAQTGYMARRLMKALEDLSVGYDGTVRNSEKNIVQFTYGDDGLDPVKMETGDSMPVDFGRLLHRVRHDDAALSPRAPRDLDAAAPRRRRGLRRRRRRALRAAGALAAKFRGDAAGFLRDLSERMADRELQMKDHCGDAALARLFDDVALSQGDLDRFQAGALDKYTRGVVEPGEAVGAIGAQCISEPGTQMTLKTFHFAGVASMNVTLGVPRLTEIINASKNISTPIITAHLDNPSSTTAARVVKARLEKTTLGEICKSMKEVYGPRSCYVSVELDATLIADLHLDVDAAAPRKRVLQADEGSSPATYHLLVEGYGLADVMGTPGVDGRRTTTNHVAEIEAVLGIEAARSTIANEITYIMSAYGIGIDARHLMLLSDVMTFKGVVLGITRFGVSKMRESVLMLASFERTTDHLFDAAAHGRRDNIVGVSECIIMGIPIPLGCGSFKPSATPTRAGRRRRRAEAEAAHHGVLSTPRAPEPVHATLVPEKEGQPEPAAKLIPEPTKSVEETKEAPEARPEPEEAPGSPNESFAETEAVPEEVAEAPVAAAPELARSHQEAVHEPGPAVGRDRPLT
ncbi:DNA-directed 5'-3' RNA polymerase [Aureococcus anophagefferens]|nr:DNA-directed 5'-3' RNA polymerase [Aureococcus anophagefferens]